MRFCFDGGLQPLFVSDAGWSDLRRLLIVLFGCIPFILLMGLGLGLVICARPFSAAIFQEGEREKEERTSLRDAQAVAFSVAGVLIFCWSLPAFLNVGTSLLVQVADPAGQRKSRTKHN